MRTGNGTPRAFNQQHNRLDRLTLRCGSNLAANVNQGTTVWAAVLCQNALHRNNLDRAWVTRAAPYAGRVLPRASFAREPREVRRISKQLGISAGVGQGQRSSQ